MTDSECFSCTISMMKKQRPNIRKPALTTSYLSYGLHQAKLGFVLCCAIISVMTSNNGSTNFLANFCSSVFFRATGIADIPPVSFRVNTSVFTASSRSGWETRNWLGRLARFTHLNIHTHRYKWSASNPSWQMQTFVKIMRSLKFQSRNRMAMGLWGRANSARALAKAREIGLVK